jgi:glycerophosphoryl diester phosphodiesterase
MAFQIVHHMAALDGFPNPPNSLGAVKACLDADAGVIEIDITPLAGDDFLLVHDPDLESETTGSGKVGECPPEQAKTYKLKHRGVATEHPPALLSEVVAAFLARGRATRLQLDYKAVFPSVSDEALRRVVRLIEPLGDRVIISSGADWHLRKLRRLASWLDLGFDIGFYLDWRDPSWETDPRMPPYLRGAYDYHDDHLLAKMALLPKSAYLAERCEMLLGQLPDASTWYVSHHVIARCLDDGFNMTAWLHENNVRMDAWTLDTDKPAAVTNAPRLLAAGVDLFTTNTPTAMATLLNGGN